MPGLMTYDNNLGYLPHLHRTASCHRQLRQAPMCNVGFLKGGVNLRTIMEAIMHVYTPKSTAILLIIPIE